jgi:hypothetical protein
MINYRFTTIWLAGMCVLTTTQAAAAELPQDLIACRQLASAVERLDCYDEFVDANKRSTNQAPAAAPARQPEPVVPAASAAATAATATNPPAEISQEDLFGKNMDEIQKSVQEATGTIEIDRIVATITNIRSSAGGKAIITLDNGQVWTQIDSSKLRLSSYDKVTIRRASLGSFMLNKSGSKTPMRVKRIS